MILTKNGVISATNFTFARGYLVASGKQSNSSHWEILDAPLTVAIFQPISSQF